MLENIESEQRKYFQELEKYVIDRLEADKIKEKIENQNDGSNFKRNMYMLNHRGSSPPLNDIFDQNDFE